MIFFVDLYMVKILKVKVKLKSKKNKLCKNTEMQMVNYIEKMIFQP